MSISHARKLAIRPLVGIGLGVTALIVAVAPAAMAHVTVSSPGATQGGFGTLVFKVPNESDTASTVKITVAFPEQTPIAYVSYQPVTGWTTSLAKTKLATPIKTDEGDDITEAVSSITWTANKGSGISQGQFMSFPVSAGPLPKTASISFNATQTYSDGKVVQWNEQETAGGSEPEHPAPTLMLAESSGSEHGASADPSSTTSSSSSNGWSIAALVVAILALVVGIVAIVIGRRKA